MQQGLSDPLISITQSGVIGVNGWQAYEKSLGNLFSFEKDPSLLSEKYNRFALICFNLKHVNNAYISLKELRNQLRVILIQILRSIVKFSF